MHLFSKAIGLGNFPVGSDIFTLLDEIINDAVNNNKIIYDKEAIPNSSGLVEAEICKSFLATAYNPQEDRGGIVIRGMYHVTDNHFTYLFYFPYVVGRTSKYNIEVMIERQSDKEAYLVHCNDPKREVSPIFFLKNIVEYLSLQNKEKRFYEKDVFLSALSIQGKVILPVKKTEAQIKKCLKTQNQRNELIDKALKGDQEAIDNLNIKDYDIISSIVHRVKKEDIYSIVDSALMPTGLECDIYSVIGNIISVEKIINKVTEENVYYLELECNDVIIDTMINESDLYGIPQVGCRFLGKIWLQGNICFDI